MTKEQAIAMLKAKRECIELDTKGNAELCDRNCGECKLNYEQGNMGEQKEALDIAIKALEIVEEFEKAQIITGGRLNGRTYAYKCGLEDGKRKALEQQPSDCVSRADLLKLYEDRFIELQKAHHTDKQLGVNWCINTLKEVPPVTPTFPKDATNGDMLTALFGEKALITLDTHNYLKNWWNAPYKRGSEDGSN